MKEKEFKLIIDREKQEKDVQQYFSKHLELLVDLVNYGSNLVPRVFDSSSRKLEDIIVILVLLKQVISMADAVEVLISKGAVTQANLQARAAFEASLYIDWIPKEDKEKKAKYYYVSNLRGQRLWSLRFQTGTKEKEIFAKQLHEIEDHFKPDDLSTLEKQAGEELIKIDSFLNRPNWAKINNEFEQRKTKRTGEEVYWFRLLGINSIRQLADKVERLGEYNLFYSRGSEVIHAVSYKDHVQFIKKGVVFEPIRQLRDIQFVLRFITITVITTYISILKQYRYGELTSFIRKYLNDWREAFLNIPTVSYTQNLRRLGLS
jgi:hypothetical protein